MINTNSEDNRKNSSISLLDFAVILVKHLWFIVSSTLFSGVFIVLFLLTTTKLPPDHKWNLLPNYYEPSAEILIQQTDQSILSKLSASGGTPLSIMMGVQSNPELDMAKTLLEGNIIKDKVIEEYNFPEKYGLTESSHPKISARNIFNKSLEIERNEATGGVIGNIFKLKYKATDPLFAKEVLSSTVELLEERFRNITMERVVRKKTFVEERLKTVEFELRQAQDDFVDFQEEYGISDISSQTREQSEMIEELQTEIIKNQLEIQTLREYLPENSPRIVRLEQEINNKKQLIDELKTGLKEYSGQIIPLNELPYLTTQYLELKNELEIKQSIYKMLRNEYEAVKIQENDNSRTFQVIEPPELLVVKTGPKRLLICIIMTITVFVLSIFFSFLKEYIERIKKDPIESKKIEQMKSFIKNRNY